MTKPASIVFRQESARGYAFLRNDEVVLGWYETVDGLQPGDVFLRMQESDDKWETRPRVVVRRQVELSEEESALVQAGINFGRYGANGQVRAEDEDVYYDEDDLRNATTAGAKSALDYVASCLKMENFEVINSETVLRIIAQAKEVFGVE